MDYSPTLPIRVSAGNRFDLSAEVDRQIDVGRIPVCALYDWGDLDFRTQKEHNSWVTGHSSSNISVDRLTACTQSLCAVFTLHHAAAAVLSSVPGGRSLTLATAPVCALRPTGGPLGPFRPATIHCNMQEKSCFLVSNDLITVLGGMQWIVEQIWCNMQN